MEYLIAKTLGRIAGWTIGYTIIGIIGYLIVTVINYFFVYQFKIPLWGYLIIGAFARYLLIGIIADLIYRKKYK